MVPSVMLSAPNSGVLTSTIFTSPEAAAGAASDFFAGSADLAGAAPAAPGVKLQRGLPTSTVSSGFAMISVMVPSSSAATSTLTLSVSMMTRISPFFTWSPAFTFHSMMVPSVMLSAPKLGVLMGLLLKERARNPERGAAMREAGVTRRVLLLKRAPRAKTAEENPRLRGAGRPPFNNRTPRCIRIERAIFTASGVLMSKILYGNWQFRSCSV
mmetsp:Transcript_57421/g.122134  ORF Transcript_57421/g.122134 Transcript_57421/m.122134 type:complete len:213 (-) Transcript_57421:10-648(-)